MKFAPEGYSYIGFFLLATMVGLPIGGWWFAAPLFILALFMAYFFRDPERKVPEGDNIFVSPADGKIILIQEGYEDKFIKGDAVEISIFMSPLNVHVNRSPYDGIVESVVHTKGRFMSAFKHEASVENENIAMALDTKHGKMLVRQVAGFVARRAVCRVKQGDILKRGQRYGVIKFSSRVDVYLPKNTVVNVKLGDRVKAGETILGEV